jgi:hypothetical protein
MGSTASTQSGTATTSSDQTGTQSSQGAMSSDQAGTQSSQGATSSAQTGTSAAGGQAGTSTKAGNRLPQTASPLPLIGLLGLGSFAAGIVARRRK